MPIGDKKIQINLFSGLKDGRRDGEGDGGWDGGGKGRRVEL